MMKKRDGFDSLEKNSRLRFDEQQVNKEVAYF